LRAWDCFLLVIRFSSRRSRGLTMSIFCFIGRGLLETRWPESSKAIEGGLRYSSAGYY
jgi:hypothetical protein